MEIIQPPFTYSTTGSNSVSLDSYSDNGPTVEIPSSIVDGITTYNVTSITNGAFDSISGITSITFQNPCYITSFGNFSFSGIDITSFTMPNSVITIDVDCFYGCNSLTSVTLSTSLTTIPSQSFYGTNITSINIPASVVSISTEAFNTLTSVFIPSTVNSIGSNSFRNITNVTIEDPSLTSVFFCVESGWICTNRKFNYNIL